MEEKPIMVNLNAINETVKKAYKKSCFGDWSALDDMDIFDELGAFYVGQAIRETLIRNIDSFYKVTEVDVHEWFFKNCSKVLDGYFLTKRRNHEKHQPDAWAIKNGKYVPVECKLGEFDAKALKQLLRYMDFYKTDEGIAVAKELCCELPPNIKFVKHEVA